MPETTKPTESSDRSPAPAEPYALDAAGIGNLCAAWLIPGAGHFLVGRRGRALAFGLIVAIAVCAGALLDGNLHRVVENQPLTILGTLASMGSGAIYFVLRYLVGYEGNVEAMGYEYGTAFFITAGLMNLLLVLDVWDIMSGRKG